VTAAEGTLFFLIRFLASAPVDIDKIAINIKAMSGSFDVTWAMAAA
jgi:hypothetical protein